MERKIVVSTYNSIEIEGHEVVRLCTPYAGPYYYNMLNLGPCTVYMRDDDDPDEDDERSLTLPPHIADNLVLIPDGPEGLRLKAGPPCTAHAGPPRARITMRLVRG
jgi:hypothetical protein